MGYMGRYSRLRLVGPSLVLLGTFACGTHTVFVQPPVLRPPVVQPVVVVPDVPSVPTLPERVSGDALLDVRGNFCNLFDPEGRIVYTPALPGAPDAVFDEWMRIQREAGSTHVFFGPPSGGPAYPGVAWGNPDFWGDLPAFRAFVEKVLSTPAADGKGFRPVIFVGGDTFAESHFDQWGALADALDGLRQYLTVSVAWEPVVGGWRSSEVSRALIRLHELFPESKIAMHFSPGRWVASSNPVEPDDPWQGDEAGFYKSHGGEFIDEAFYQAPHGVPHWVDCDEDHDDSCWLNRLQDGVARVGAGFHGWRVMHVTVYEVVAYEAFRHQVTSEQARQAATHAKRICDKWNVPCGFGNGLPE